MLMEHEARSTENHDQHNRQSSVARSADRTAEGMQRALCHRQNLMQRVMRMPNLEVRDHLVRLKASHFPGT
jgi:hypothetical protein